MTGYVTKNPPVKLILNEMLFNNLVQLLVNNEHSENEVEVKDAKELKNKILKYSVIYTEDNQNTIDIRLFISEASKLIMMLNNNNKINTNIDYVSVLRENKKSINK